MHRVETENLYSEMATFKHLLDLSDCPEDHFLHYKTNKKVPFTMTDELQGKVLSEVVCLRSKLYRIVFNLKAVSNRVQKEYKKVSKKP